MSGQEHSAYWNKEAEVREAIVQAGGITPYVQDLPNKQLVFNDSSTVLTCMDERVCEGIRAAGSLILVPLEEAESFCEKAGVTGITSHAGCGAAGVLYRKNNRLDAATTIPSGTLEEFSKQTAQELANSLRLPYLGHITYEEMDGPEDAHIARSAYYVGVPNFNPNRDSGMPKGFVIERVYHTEANAVAELELAIGIALGSHGFGELITAAAPMYLYVVGNESSPVPLEQLRHEAEAVAAAFEGRVAVEALAISE